MSDDTVLDKDLSLEELEKTIGGASDSGDEAAVEAMRTFARTSARMCKSNGDSLEVALRKVANNSIYRKALSYEELSSIVREVYGVA